MVKYLKEIKRKLLGICQVLYPKLVKGGVLHIDDYGFLPGARKAVDEYFKDEKIWLHRIDLSCRLLIKN